MGLLNAAYRKSIIDDIVYGIQSNNVHYYAYISNPLENASNTTLVTTDDYSAIFEPIWKMLFGKKIYFDDIAYVIQRNIWKDKTVYSYYDNTKVDLRIKNDFYVISQPLIVGGDYHVYICIDNNNGAPSTVDPGTVTVPTLETTFQTSDGYKWRYICSTPDVMNNKFGTTKFFPVKKNIFLSSTASSRTGVEKIVIVDPGVGYATHNQGFFVQTVNSSFIQISNGYNRSVSGFFNDCDIYFNTGNMKTSEIHTITQYTSNNTGCYVRLATNANTINYVTGNSIFSTTFSIAPRVVITSDGNVKPKAYATIDANTSNSISTINILEMGNNVTWANATVINTGFGSGANIYCICPPPGGFGYDPASELNVKGLSFSLDFSKTESNTILGDGAVYNKFGIVKNPHSMYANTSKGNPYTANTFDNTLKATLTSPVSIPQTSDQVVGQTSGARGVVVYANSTYVAMTGDRHFVNGEVIVTSSNTMISQISIIEKGDIYQKDLYPLYVQNINSVNRSNTQTETFKLIVKV